jgi:hypothetical protein
MDTCCKFVMIMFYVSSYDATPAIDGIVIPVSDNENDEKLIYDMLPYSSMGTAWLLNFGKRFDVAVIYPILGMDRYECAELIFNHIVEADNWHEYFIHSFF